ncbi:MAG: SBBP repeat-containing protein [Acidobacteriota bacterium]|nr:SBBP repeat-containing protein [Acidobacteriota bacterium]
MVIAREYKAGFILLFAILVPTAFGFDKGSNERIVTNVLPAQLAFERLGGRDTGKTQFLSRTPNYTIFIEPSRATIAVKGTARATNQGAVVDSGVRSRFVRVQLLGSRQSEPSVQGPLPAHTNYFIGSDPHTWRTNIPLFQKVIYTSVYNKVDLVYYGTDRQLEYDFVIRPGGTPKGIQFAVTGAKPTYVLPSGDLSLGGGEAGLVLHRPVAHQMSHGQRRDVPASFVEIGTEQFGFKVGSFNHRLPLIIDPVLAYSTYLGGSNDEGIFGIGFDKQGNIYVAGETSSLDFPLKNTIQNHVAGNYDAFVSKFDPTGKELIYSTYLGGSQFDHAVGIQVDDQGSAYIAGITLSPDFPVKNALQSSLGGRSDGFVAKLSPSGSELIFSTYLGGEGSDDIGALAIDHGRNVYVTGRTQSLHFPVTSKAFQQVCDGGANQGFCVTDAFVSKIDPSGRKLLYSTYLGGTGFDSASGIAVDDHGEAYIAGQTSSRDFPTRKAYQSSLMGFGDAFLAKLNARGSELVFSTYFGGTGFEGATDIALDHSQNVYITGTTSSTDFPLTRAFQSQNHGGFTDGFVTKFNPGASKLIYSTYLGGAGFDFPFRLAVTGTGEAMITGFTSSTDFPVYEALQPIYGGGPTDSFVTHLSRGGNELRFSTYLGGSSDEYGYSIASGCEGSVWIGGSTSSKNFPVVEAFQDKFAGGPYDAFLSKIVNGQSTKECPAEKETAR